MTTLADVPSTQKLPFFSRIPKGVRIALSLVLICFALLFWAYVREARLILEQPITSWTEDSTADCAIVLTGGPNRIRDGVDLLARKNVQKLIIAGVHPQAGFRDIFPLWPFYGDIKEQQDVILERRSLTTYGNAQQALPLVEALRCRDVILITSRLHMRRALKTFRAEFPPDFKIIPRAIVSSGVRPGPWELILESTKALFYALWAY